MSRPKILLLAIALAAMSLTALVAPAGASAAAPSAKTLVREAPQKYCPKGKIGLRIGNRALCVRKANRRKPPRAVRKPRAQASLNLVNEERVFLGCKWHWQTAWFYVCSYSVFEPSGFLLSNQWDYWYWDGRAWLFVATYNCEARAWGGRCFWLPSL